MVRILPSLHLLCRSEIIFQFYGGIWLFLSRTICHNHHVSVTTFIRSKPKGSIDLRVPGTPTATEIYCGLVLEAWFWQCQPCEVHLGEEMFKLPEGIRTVWWDSSLDEARLVFTGVGWCEWSQHLLEPLFSSCFSLLSHILTRCHLPCLLAVLTARRLLLEMKQTELFNLGLSACIVRC